jgi:hypothetical protein
MEQVILALLTARSTEEAAKSIGVAHKTLLRWQKLPEFDRKYREARMVAFRQSKAQLQRIRFHTVLFDSVTDATNVPQPKPSRAKTPRRCCCCERTL